MRLTRCFIPTLLLLAPAVIPAQDPAANPARPAFEAAVIKPNNSGQGGSSSRGTRGQILMTNQPLRQLVQRALDIKPFQLETPAWTETLRYDIAAKYPENSKPEDRPRMLRTLMEDRFGLVFHVETRDMPGYELVVAKGGFKLQPVDAGNGPSQNSNSDGKTVKIKMERLTMPFLATFLSGEVGSMIVDRTGLAGAYSFEMQWAQERLGANEKADVENDPSLYQELQEKLGLKLQSAKVPTPIYIVDKLNRTPSDN